MHYSRKPAHLLHWFDNPMLCGHGKLLAYLGCGFLEYDRFLYNIEGYLMISEQERRTMASDGLLKKPETRLHCLKLEAPWLACSS